MVMLWNGFLKVINGKDREKRSKTDAFPNEDELIWKRSQKSGYIWKGRHIALLCTVENGAFSKLRLWMTSKRRATSFRASRLKLKQICRTSKYIFDITDLFNRSFGT